MIIIENVLFVALLVIPIVSIVASTRLRFFLIDFFSKDIHQNKYKYIIYFIIWFILGVAILLLISNIIIHLYLFFTSF